MDVKTPPPAPPPPISHPTPRAVGGREAFNIVTDTVGGPNVRWRDNLFQALAIFGCVVVGAIIGAFVVSDWRGGLFVGGFCGLLAGLFGSGIFLMLYRAGRHLRGKHD